MVKMQAIGFLDLVDKTSFKKLILIWIIMIVGFGMLYFFVSFSSSNSLLYGDAPIKHSIEGLFDSVYFSFITATTLGYGDITPQGFLKLFSILEAVLGLLIFGIVISKLMGTKQDAVLDEIYDIAFEENIDRLRSALYLFREDVNKVIAKIEHRTITKQEVNDMWMMMTTFDTALLDIYKTLCPLRRNMKEYYKKVEGVRLELLFNSIRLSLSKLQELVVLLEENRVNWKNSTIMGSITADIGIISNILTYYKDNESIDKKNSEKLDEIKKVKETIQLALEPKKSNILQVEEKPAEKEAKYKKNDRLVEIPATIRH